MEVKPFKAFRYNSQVILAMGQGRIAAAAINDYLAKKKESTNQ
jgi:NADPH-dependent glutamate synthase beta subunit-like oxidoreductase